MIPLKSECFAGTSLSVCKDGGVVSLDEFGDKLVDAAAAKDGLGCIASVMYDIDLHPLHLISRELYEQLLWLRLNFDNRLLRFGWPDFDGDLDRCIFDH